MQGRPLTRRGFLRIDPPGPVAAGGAFTLRGTAVPNGSVVQVCVAGGDNTVDAPVAGWSGDVQSDAAGNWQYPFTVASAGPVTFWARFRDRPFVHVGLPVAVSA